MGPRFGCCEGLRPVPLMASPYGQQPLRDPRQPGVPPHRAGDNAERRRTLAPASLAERLATHYPTSSDARLFKTPGLPTATMHHTEYGAGYLFRWPATIMIAASHENALDRVAPDVGPGGCRWLRPAVAGVALSPLLTWWISLFGLSMLARYEPAKWTAALDYDTSELAAPLDHLLQVALERVPQLVLTALYPAV